MGDTARGYEAARISKSGETFNLFHTAGAAKALDGGDGVWVAGSTVHIENGCSARIFVIYGGAGSEASADVQCQISHDAGTTWVPLGNIAAVSGGVQPLRNEPLRVTPTGTASAGVDGGTSFLVGLSADDIFRVRVRCNTPGATPGSMLVVGRRGLWT